MKRTCPTPDCGRPSLLDRSACSTCHKRAYRAAHPIRTLWHDFHHHARERGIAVGLDWWEFREFCLVTGYHKKRGQEADSLTIDRHDAEQGYDALNIRLLTRAENSRKWHLFDKP